MVFFAAGVAQSAAEGRRRSSPRAVWENRSGPPAVSSLTVAGTKAKPKPTFRPNGDPAILVATGPSREFNPSLSQRVIDRAYARDATAATIEYGGEWRSDIAAFISRDAVMACVDFGVHERPYREANTYFGFVDPSGGSNDSMTLAHGSGAGRN